MWRNYDCQWALLEMLPFRLLLVALLFRALVSAQLRRHAAFLLQSDICKRLPFAPFPASLLQLGRADRVHSPPSAQLSGLDLHLWQRELLRGPATLIDATWHMNLSINWRTPHPLSGNYKVRTVI